MPLLKKNSYFQKVNNENTIKNSATNIPATDSVKKLELPYFTKYLLISAYLASHNDAKIDKRLFMKHHGKQRKRLQTIKANAVVCFK